MKIGSIGYATEQGLGHLVKDFWDNGIITDLVLVRRPHVLDHPEWYPAGTPRMTVASLRTAQEVDHMISRVQAMLFFETPFNWDVLNKCRAAGVKTVMVPMYEWWPKNPPAWPDKFVCPSDLDFNIFNTDLHLHKCERLNIPVDPSAWKLRTTARRFLHNSGHVGHREHKGTRQLIESLAYLKSPLRLTIRTQERDALNRTLTDAARDDPRVTIQYGHLPRKQLFLDHDVYVAPEKFNGCSLPLSESRASGLLVVTTDRYPMNAWLPKEPLIPVESYSRQNISGAYLEFDEAIVNPRQIAEVMDFWYGKDISSFSLSGRDWAEQNSWPALKDRWMEVLSNA